MTESNEQVLNTPVETEPAIPKAKKIHGMVEKVSVGRIIFLIIAIALLVFTAFICILPLWHVIMASFSDGFSLYTSDSILFIPVGKISFEGYKLVFALPEVWKGYAMTIFYVVASTLLGVFLTLCGGYYLSRKTLWTKFVGIFIIITMMFSGGLVPTYMVIRSLGMINTPFAIIIPGCTNAIYIMMAATAFRAVPASIEEAARLDGCGHWRMMFKIYFPMAKGIMMVVAMNCVVMQWNSWFAASIYLPTERDLWPLQLVMKDLMAQYSEANILQKLPINFDQFNIQYILIVISTIPLLIACPFFQRYFGNATIGGVKE